MVATDDEIQVLCFSFFFCFNHIFCSAFEKSLRARLVKVIIPTVKIHFWTQQYCSINNFFFLSKSDKPRHWLPLPKNIWFILQTGYPNTCGNILLCISLVIGMMVLILNLLEHFRERQLIFDKQLMDN